MDRGGHRGRRVLVAGAFVSAVAALATSGPAAAVAAPTWATRVVAVVPAPGYPAMAYATPQGTILEGTYQNPTGSSAPSLVLELTATGSVVGQWGVPGETLSGPHGVQVGTLDAAGHVVLLELGPPSALLLDRSTGTVTTYATFADLPTCSPGTTAPRCSPSLQDLPPEPDYAVWGADGGLYVSDYQQAVIWRVPPGGGAAQVWLADRRLDGEQFGTAGLAFAADGRTLLVAQASSAGGGEPDVATGKLYAVAVAADGSPGPMQLLWRSRPGDAPDGIAVARSGHVYVALVSPSANQLVELAADGTELARFPTVPATGANGSTVPFDSPSSVRFLGQELVVANQAYATGNAQHMAVLAVDVGEPGLAERLPAGAVTAGAPVPTPTPSTGPASPAPAAAGSATPATAVGLVNTARGGTAAEAWPTVLTGLVVAGSTCRRRRRDSSGIVAAAGRPPGADRR